MLKTKIYRVGTEKDIGKSRKKLKEKQIKK